VLRFSHVQARKPSAGSITPPPTCCRPRPFASQGGLSASRPPPQLRRSHPHLHSLGSAASEGPEPAVSPGAVLESEPVTPAVPRAVSLESGAAMPAGVAAEVGARGIVEFEGGAVHLATFSSR